MQQKALKTSPHLLGAHDLTKSYGRHEVVKGVKFSVAQGEIVGLLGPNGAGKTTTFRMVVGMIRPDSGQISFRGRDITALPIGNGIPRTGTLRLSGTHSPGKHRRHP